MAKEAHGADYRVQRATAHRVGALDIAVFVAELALLAVLAVDGARLVPGFGAVVLGVLLPVAAAVLWGRYLAPRAAHRLPRGLRLGMKLALTVVAAVLLAATGAWGWAIAFVVLASAAMTAGERSDRRRATA